MEMRITFPGGKKVNADFGGTTVPTDQPVDSGGGGSAPTPFDYFLASLGTCAGIYVLSFCQQRGIPTERVSLRQSTEFVRGDDGKQRLSRVSLEILVPPDFPEKYHGALVKAAELCAVKKALMHPPAFDIATIVV